VIEPVVALFCGSRTWIDPSPIRDAIAALPTGSVVLQGGAQGADRLAKAMCHNLHVHCAQIDAMWWHLGSSAGPRRNSAMLLLQPSVVYAFQIAASSGTQDMIDKARRAGLSVYLEHR
jgi:hypothetical protein